MNWQDVIKPFSLTPAVQTNDSPFDKGYTRIASNVSPLSTYIQVPQNLTQDAGYKRRLMFQYNFTNESDFYIVNATQLMNFGAMIIYGGCLCIKWRAGMKLVNGVLVPNVLRYRLLDSNTIDNWSFFSLYASQRIKVNFCIEFWSDNTQATCGITQDILFQTDKISIPASVDDGDFVTPIDTGVKTLANLVQPIPLVFPIDWSTEAYLDNI